MRFLSACELGFGFGFGFGLPNWEGVGGKILVEYAEFC